MPQAAGMDPEHTKLVQQSFALVAPIADQAGLLFYDRLFRLDPALRGLFPADVRDQSRKLMQMLAIAVNNLDRLESIVPAVRALGRRHVGYGVTERHFETVGEALLSTLEQGLGPAFTPEVRQAWATVYGVLTQTMLEAMREHRVDPVVAPASPALHRAAA
jgi:hemoglobin-like flavoprotein